jgi:predicted DNA-binding transcriptional regulator AlpA
MSIAVSSLPRLLSPREVSQVLRIREQTLAIWRLTNRYGLPFVKVGGRVAYKETDIAAFLSRRTVGGDPSAQ